MTWVKICGLTRDSDVADAIEAGADALGFVLASESPRVVGTGRAASLMAGVPALRILVTVDADRTAIEQALEATSADGVQPHGLHADRVARWARGNGFFVLRPVRQAVAATWDLSAIPNDQIPLLDSTTGDSHGGTGVPLDWGAIRIPERRFVLAGGLTPANIADAIEIVHPWGVDASSGLESAPGIKDPARVAAFVQEAKRP